jgi:hypothetical protein
LADIIFTFLSLSIIFFIWFAVLLGRILKNSKSISFSSSTLYSDNLKLSVDANVISFHFIVTANQASSGLMLHSADENNVLFIDFFNISHFIVKFLSSFIVGINGNSFASNHLMFI